MPQGIYKPEPCPHCKAQVEFVPSYPKGKAIAVTRIYTVYHRGAGAVRPVQMERVLRHPLLYVPHDEVCPGRNGR